MFLCTNTANKEILILSDPQSAAAASMMRISVPHVSGGGSWCRCGGGWSAVDHGRELCDMEQHQKMLRWAQRGRTRSAVITQASGAG